jgi:hypothetical protein
MSLPLDPVSLALQGAQTAFGIAQLVKGKKMERNNKRPTYEIPDEVKKNLSQAQMQAMGGLPEAQKNQYIQNLQRAGNFGLSAMSDRKGGLAGLESLVQGQNDAYTGLLSADAQAHQQNLQNLQQQRQNMAEYQDKSFDYNKDQPYQQKLAQSQALMGAGLQNIGGGLGSMAQGLQQKNLYGQMGDNGEQEPTMSYFQMQRQKKLNQGLQTFAPINQNQIGQ